MKKLLPLALAAMLGLSSGCATVQKGIGKNLIRNNPNLTESQKEQALSDVDSGILTKQNAEQYFKDIALKAAVEAQGNTNTSRLPDRTPAESQFIEESLKDNSILYTENGNVYRQNITDGSRQDLSSKLTQTYGHLHNLKANGENELFFIKGNSLFRYSVEDGAENISLVVSNADIEDYEIGGDSVIFVERRNNHPEVLKKVNKDGSGLEVILGGQKENVSSLSVTSDGKNAVCVLVPRARYTRNDKRKPVHINLDNGKQREINFPDSYVDRIEKVALADNGNLWYVKTDSKGRGDIYFANSEGAKQITFDNAVIYDLTPAGDGLAYISDRSGVPAAYLFSEGVNVTMSDYFGGHGLYTEALSNSSKPSKVVKKSKKK
ncbi:hypothetical protein JXB27_02485 [Candidatus Woesearchaeota archaeon]|nr:hypothetical protein [Candidatus Woesearchaeota archaeon]